MTAFLLSVHVLAAIVTVGPVAVAASMFPPAARAAPAATVRVLHRVTRVYAVIGILVPVFGLATGAALGVLGDAWLIVSMVLTAGAAAVLVGLVLPAQRRTLTALDVGEAIPDGIGRRLAMHTGVFNVLWAVVVVLMIYRPGSTTGVGP
ncbi:DUF2269 family protein [Actinophytocola gossypii]|uniref:DUF2269 family protein n=1 Tax=Actinophytocola gossypii TaxID=2812003 RepID=A0ABT2JBP7_9PSEU|nr:hypothetical protein [Actinophytocola gossypii]MCT2585291.1 hypothetical protein [Actinophytocola gossypii]